VITWFGKKKTFVALISEEVEHMEASMASCESIWIHKLLTSFI
jgi:hypothetical protein